MGVGPLHTQISYIDLHNFSSSEKRKDFDCKPMAPKDVMFMFLCFFNWPGDTKHLGSAGRQADEYIAPGGKFFCVFYVSNFAYMN